MDTIGERMVAAIEERAKKKGITTSSECRRLGISREVFWRWKNTVQNPNAYFIAQVALEGYDIYWILTGVKK